MSVEASSVYLLCVCGVFVHSFVGFFGLLVDLFVVCSFASLVWWFCCCLVVCAGCCLHVWSFGGLVACFVGLQMGLCVCVLVCRVVRLRWSCVALLYESPGGNQVDGLPPAFHLRVIRDRCGASWQLFRYMTF